ncbi:adenylate/guanylate cyclase domain-containing protein [Corallococcus sp. AB049A]|uniref:Adenylate/guanylate cyclase domain-containing protein n=1 Tax=Corallococcus interemptor TaxID=2316720 RepID=A0A3A8Q524_9BACT|nr:adenylate/guanylate cyclase domain-containing protein [Corallococcus interemptor]RKI65680.1 adenylate/guanylate cyclase domain-containing protein [Corallococcus sp. AB049A]
MNCPQCSTPNAHERRFCGECGGRLAVRCGACRFENDPGARFCGGCGVRLEAPLKQAPAPPPAPAPPQEAGERRQVTVLFADLAGYTRLSTELDPEDLHALIGEYFRRLDALVSRYGGTVERHIGDAVMGVFGAPVAHDNDALRAVRVGLDIHKVLEEMSQEFGRTLEGHVGIAAGEVVTAPRDRQGRHEFAVVGETVNLASRLSSRAQAGEVLISDAVHALVGPRIGSESVGELVVKGIPHPVRVWRVLGTCDDAPEHLAPFVGRARELARFSACLRSCAAEGRGEVVLIEGEAGIGKSHLTEQLVTRALDGGFAVHGSYVLDFGASSGEDAVHALARSLVCGKAHASREERQQAADALFERGTLPGERRLFLNDLLDLPQPVELRALRDAMDQSTRVAGRQRVFVELAEQACSRRPVLFVVEDVHWADAETLTQLHALSEVVRASSAVLLLTSRVEGSPRHTWPAEKLAPLVIELAPLGDDEALELAHLLVSGESQYIKLCIERARGNPLFLEQLVRHASGTATFEVPASIQSLVLARMDRLPVASKAAIQAASVIGQRFDLAALHHLIGDDTFDCEPLVREALFDRVSDGFMFKHVLIRDGVYASLLRAKRREVHLKLAAWYLGKDASLRAQHLDRGESREAPLAYLEAAQAAASTYRYEQALGLVRRGRELAREAHEKGPLLLLEGELLREMGAVQDSLALYRSVLSLAADPALVCRAKIGLAGGMRVSDDIDGALACLDEAQALGTAQGLTAELAQIHYLRGSLYFPRGNLAGCLEQHSAAHAYARRAGLPEREAHALSGLGDAYYAQGRMQSARGYFHECLELCRRFGFGKIEAANRFMIATVRIYMNELEGALADALASAAMAAQVGHKRAEIISRLTAGWILLDYQRDEEALGQARQGLALAGALGARRFEPFLNETVARVLMRRGERQKARELLESSLVYVRQHAASFIGPWLLGTLALATDDAEQRRQALTEGERLLASGCVSHNHYRLHQAGMEACLAAGETAEALRHAASLEAFTRVEPAPWSDFYIRRCRALARPPADGHGGELRALAEEARTVGLHSAIPALEAAAQRTSRRMYSGSYRPEGESS